MQPHAGPSVMPRRCFPEQVIELLGSSHPDQLRYKIDRELLAHANSADVAVRWTVYADDMPPKRGGILMRSINKF